jgi:hypothetical protein
MRIDNPSSKGISAGFGIPTGGTANQILSKVDGTNYNTQWIDNGLSTYISTTKNSTPQSISAVTYTQLTNFDTSTVGINASEWNRTTGVFTATKAGIYSVTAQIQFDVTNYIANNTVAVQLRKNGSPIATGFAILPVTAFIFPSCPVVTAIVQLAVGETLTIWAFTGTANATFSSANNLTIQELPSRLIR